MVNGNSEEEVKDAAPLMPSRKLKLSTLKSSKRLIPRTFGG